MSDVEAAKVEEHRMPNGSVIYFRNDDHAYWEAYDAEGNKCKGRIAGISTVAKNDGNTYSDPLINWGVKLAYEGVAREASLGLSLDDPNEIRTAQQWLRSPEQIAKAMKEEKADWESIRNEKGTIGWKAHDVLQALAEGKTPEAETPYDYAVISWWEAHQPEPLQVEQVVYSEKLGLAGRFDLRCGLGKVDSFAPVVSLLDCKTGGFVSNAWALQLNLYNMASIEAGFGGADHLFILQVNEQAQWREIDVPKREDWALAALATYNTGKEIKGEMVKAKKVEWSA